MSDSVLLGVIDFGVDVLKIVVGFLITYAIVAWWEGRQRFHRGE